MRHRSAGSHTAFRRRPRRGPGGRAAELNAALLGAAALGVPDCARRRPGQPDGQAALAALADVALAQVQDAREAGDVATTSLTRIRPSRRHGVHCLTGFTRRASDLGQAFGESTAVQGGDPLAATTWVQRMSRVRGAVDRLQQALTYAEAISLTPGPRFEVGQLPYLPGDRWGGLAGPLAGGKLALIAHAPFAWALDGSQPLAGLMIDEVTRQPNPGEHSRGVPLRGPGRAGTLRRYCSRGAARRQSWARPRWRWPSLGRSTWPSASSRSTRTRCAVPALTRSISP